MKKLTAILSLIFIIALSFTSCSEIEIVELNERLIIEAIGIDYEDGIYKVTIEGLDSFTAGSDSNSISSESLTKCFLFEGKTIGMAMNSISVITGQTPLFSQARILVLGNTAAKERLSETLDFFRREYTTRTDILIAVAEKKASDIISADFGKNVSAGNILEAALESYKHTGTSCFVPLYKFLNALKNETDCAFCPLIGIRKNAYSDTYEADIKGTQLLKNNESAVLSPEETAALMMINNETENGDLTAKTKNGICTIEIIDCRTKIKVETNSKKVIFSISSDIRCDIPEYQTADLQELTKSDTEEIADTAARLISEAMAGLINEKYINQNFDIFHFGRRLLLKFPELYKSLTENENTINKNAVFNISVSVSVRRIGKVVLEK